MEGVRMMVDECGGGVIKQGEMRVDDDSGFSLNRQDGGEELNVEEWLTGGEHRTNENGSSRPRFSYMFTDARFSYSFF